MNRRGEFASIVFGATVVAGIATIWVVSESHPPCWRLNVDTQRIVAKPGSVELGVDFVVTNIGGSKLLLRESVSTCGCTVASISPSVLKPGQRGVIHVVGKPLSAGERRVQVSVKTNSESQGDIKLTLFLVGSRLPPFIDYCNGPVTFGSIKTLSDSQLLEIDTMEPKGSTGWLGEPRCSSEYVKVTGGCYDALQLEDGTMRRKHSFQIELKELPPPGEFAEEIVFHSIAGDQTAMLTVPVTGKVQLPVEVSPSSLFASILPSENSFNLSLTFTSADKHNSLEVKVSDGLPSALDCHFVRVAKDKVVCTINANTAMARSGEGIIRFKTNNPLASLVSVPFSLHLSN